MLTYAAVMLSIDAFIFLVGAGGEDSGRKKTNGVVVFQLMLGVANAIAMIGLWGMT
jgi:hypothetical protein